ncbi:hypothetical protein HMPREF0012_01795 [Acinetobacter calcoaceticus RUH2202]|uniref:hypothetical protein n=1 Tax=Acinetobacter calcoaceticus TaxID=471 RepID=UPI0001BB5368|nr:hypothetical protein [Acinetobacter calcoaceticus]EEY78926.1 hypothetical protein HMPREF0012_01795 [Acinetobacter calcoaceticus RUH2202]
MDKCREEFERSKTFKYFYSTLMHFDEELNCYSSNNSLRVRDAELLTAAWWAFQEQQAKADQLKGQLIKLGFTDNGGELLKPSLGVPPRFDLLDELKNSLNEITQKYRVEAHELSRIRDFEKSQMYSHFARELDQLLKGGA